MIALMRLRCFVIVMGTLVSLSGWQAAQAAKRVTESGRDIPVAFEVDVVVVGGASRAVAAAMSAAQQGASVFLAAPRLYLGEDLCSTYRLWLDPCEVPTSPLAMALYAEPSTSSYGKNPLPFTYTADRPSADPHQDSAGHTLLCDGKWHSASRQSVQYNGPVTFQADLGQARPVRSVSVLVYQRPGDFEVTEVSLEASTNGQDWASVGTMKNSHPGQGFEQQALALSTAMDQKIRYIRVRVRPAPGTQRVLLGEIFIEGETQPRVPKTSRRVPPTPMQVKRVLDQALLETGVSFLYGCCPTDVLCDSEGELAGIVVSNRSGRQAIKAKVIIDATPLATVTRLAGVRFERRDSTPCQFKRIVVGGTPSLFGKNIVQKMPTPIAGHDGRRYEAYEYTLARPWDGRSLAALTKIEQTLSDLSWQRGQVDASERLFFIPPQRVTGSGPSCQNWPGAANADVSYFKPATKKRLYVLNGSACVSATVAQQILRPIESMQIGQRLGLAAAQEAASIKALAGVTVLSHTAPGVTVAGDIGDDPVWTPPAGKTLGTIRSPEQSVPVVGEYDVVVVGGG
ncbi:MAG: FAD-dependent oxidoreductase, partial [Phycisphaeraceae bacterium]|nr:FAD-dependent oxidoreductase [Phycisphaeraceae bacterium]